MTSLDPAWTSLPHGIGWEVTTFDGRAFAPGGAALWALDLKTGQELWHVDRSGTHTSNEVHTATTVAAGSGSAVAFSEFGIDFDPNNPLFGSADGHVKYLDPATGGVQRLSTDASYATPIESLRNSNVAPDVDKSNARRVDRWHIRQSRSRLRDHWCEAFGICWERLPCHDVSTALDLHDRWQRECTVGRQQSDLRRFLRRNRQCAEHCRLWHSHLPTVVVAGPRRGRRADQPHPPRPGVPGRWQPGRRAAQAGTAALATVLLDV